MKTKIFCKASVVSITVCCYLSLAFGPTAGAQVPPHFQVDASWPKQLPNEWILGHVTGVAVDKYDHIWVLHSPSWLLDDDAGAAQTPPVSECCHPPPAVLEFDADGNVLKSWGGPNYVTDWPNNEHGLVVDGENLREINLYPIEMGYGLPRPDAGRPMLAQGKTANEILERLKRLSEPFHTKIEIQGNVGVMQIA